MRSCAACTDDKTSLKRPCTDSQKVNGKQTYKNFFEPISTFFSISTQQHSETNWRKKKFLVFFGDRRKRNREREIVGKERKESNEQWKDNKRKERKTQSEQFRFFIAAETVKRRKKTAAKVVVEFPKLEGYSQQPQPPRPTNLDSICSTLFKGYRTASKFFAKH